MHSIISGIILCAVVLAIVKQIGVLRELLRLYTQLRHLMPNAGGYHEHSPEESCSELGGNPEMMQQIDEYLDANKSVAPNFDIVKDIVERSSSELDERVRTLLPLPLYYGLCGTISGIILGLIPIVFDGGSDLMASISPLLLGVAIAMLGSFSGVLITAIASRRYKDVVSEVEVGKRKFFNWFQINMLPVLGSNPSGPLGQLMRSLSNFNSEFTQSAAIMSSTARDIANTFVTQQKLLELMQEVANSSALSKSAEIANQMSRHVDVVGAFNNSIEGMQGYVDKLHRVTRELQSSTEYLGVVRDLVNILNKEEEAIKQASGNAGKHVQEIFTNHQRLLSESLEKVEGQNQAVLSKFRQHLDSTAQSLQQSLEAHPTVPKALEYLGKLPDAMNGLVDAIKILSDRQSASEQQLSAQLQALTGQLSTLEKRLQQTSSSHGINKKREQRSEPQSSNPIHVAPIESRTNVSALEPSLTQVAENAPLEPSRTPGLWGKLLGLLRREKSDKGRGNTPTTMTDRHE